MAITLRQNSDARATTKGSSLTFSELDNNFIDLLNRATLDIEGDSGQTDVLSDGSNPGKLIVNGAGGLTTAITTDSSGQAVLTLTQGSATADVVDDTTPQLGGDLDVNGNSIVSVSNGNIAITPNGTGQVQTTNLRYDEDIHDLGTTSGTITPDVANGNVQTITLSGNLTFNAFSNPIAGQSLTLIIDTNGTGRTLTTTMKTPDATDPTMSTTDTTDICTVFYDGTNYYMNYVTNFA